MVMFIEILSLLLIIIVVLFSLLFLKSWYVHLIFKNDDLHHEFFIQINFLIFQIIFELTEDPRILDLQLKIFSKTLNIKKIVLTKTESEDKLETEEPKNEDSEEVGVYSKLNQLYPLLYDSKQELMQIIFLITKMVTFIESYAIINLGLSDNNLTIKFCILLWSLSAPLYPMGCRLLLTPEINQLKFKSDVNIKFKIKLFNLLKISYVIFKTKKLREIVELLLK